MSQSRRVGVYNVRRLMIRNTAMFCVSVLLLSGVVVSVMLHAAPNMFLSKRFNDSAILLGDNLCNVLGSLSKRFNNRDNINVLQSNKQLVHEAVNKLKGK